MTRKQKRNLKRIIISIVLFAIVFTFDKIFYLGGVLPKIDGYPNNLGWIFPFVFYFGIYIYIGHDVLKKAFLGIIHGQMLDENFLMAVATIGAFTLAIVKGCKGEEIEGFDEGCAVLLFYQVGEWFQSYAVGKSRKSISSLMDIRPDFANVKREDGTVETVNPEEIKIDDVIVVNPGEKVPLDGVIIKGSTSLDTRALTGESLPAEVAEGTDIISGSVNLSSTIEVKVTKVFYDSTVAKILDLVENAQNQKSKAENFITKFAMIYTPVVVGLAALLAVLPPVLFGLINGNWSTWGTWVYRALSFLVVSCPCALVISIPLSFFAGIGAASRYGILIKGSNYLEKFNKSNIFVFDKTGTLTKGNFAVVGVYPEDKKEEVLALAAVAEEGSSHPIAKSIIAEYGKDIKSGYTLTNEAGHGIIAKNDSEVIYCGNEKLMKAYGIDFEAVDTIGTLVYVAKNNEYIGCIVIADEVKPEAVEMITSLSTMGSKTIMLTGDNERIASDVATKLGLSNYYASLLPQDKVSHVEKLLNEKKENDVLCFVGDGINDAPVLMRSDIGIAMGGVGSDAAIEASDIVLMQDDLNGIALAKRIAKKTMTIVLENIIFALGVKIIILVLSALGITNMWIAVFGDVGVAIIAILNAMRVNSKYKESEELLEKKK